jgi:two-component system response regulator CpxR
MRNILIIDDDVALGQLVAEYLEPDGYQVEAVHNGETGAQRALSGAHDLAVLDVMLPGLNGFEVLRRIRSQSQLPVIMLTARGDDIDRIVGLEIGADDYLSKPFNPRELAARINAVLRRAGRAGTTETPAALTVGDVALDYATRSAQRAGAAVELTVVEFDLLARLLATPGRIVTREDLSNEVLHRKLSPFDRSIDMHVSNLRKKLGHQTQGQERIRTVRGIGYIYAQTD